VGSDSESCRNREGRRAAVILQERDKELLRLCYEQGFLTAEHVHEAFFRNVGTRAAYRRVQELEAAGYLRRSRLSALSGHRIIQTTPVGTGIARQLSQFEVPQKRRPALQTLDHDALVTSVRIWLMRLLKEKSAVWVPEGHLKKHGGKQIPDGVILYSNGLEMVIEVENSLKSHDRLYELMSAWKTLAPKAQVQYIASSPVIRNGLKKALDRVGPNRGIYLSLWDELRGGQTTTPRKEECQNAAQRRI